MTDSPTPTTAKLTMADIVRKFRRGLLLRAASHVSKCQRQAMFSIESCRTAVLGGHVLECESCGGERVYAFNSCNHRSCPQCMKETSAAWVCSRREELLPVPYYHVVFTVPEVLRSLIYSAQSKAYPVLMKAAGEALVSVSSRSENLGGTPAVMTSLHTSSSTLAYHLHVHCLISAGGVDEDGAWRSSTGCRIGTPNALGAKFSSRVHSMLKSAMKGVSLPESVFKQNWDVFIERPQQGTEALLAYLSRPLHCGPIAEYRLVSMTNKEVSFQHRGKVGGNWVTQKVKGVEFLRRFLQHVWPGRIHRVHYCGLWRRKCRGQLRAICESLQAGLKASQPTSTSAAPPTQPPEATCPVERSPYWLTCPHCGSPRKIIERFAAGTKPPPLTLRLTPPPLTADPPS